MERPAALQVQSVSVQSALYVALELSDKKWVVALGNSAGRVSRHTVGAGDAKGLLMLIERTRGRMGVCKQAALRCCYEAGRDGFWLHRWLLSQGIDNVVVDSASIEVNRRLRRAKTDRIDADQLLNMLKRYWAGERGLWSVLRVPTEQQEDERRAHRERERLVKERGAHQVRIKSLLVMHNVRLDRVGGKDWEKRVLALQLGEHVQQELIRQGQRLALVERQIGQLESQQRQALGGEPGWGPHQQQRQLMRLCGIGLIGAWTLVAELFWRRFENRRQLAGCVGLGSSPYSSGDSQRDQGISKAGNRRVRTLMVELAWCWLKYQPHSALSQWFGQRFGAGGNRMRRIGIVALARRLLIALWRWLQHGVIPEGARLKAAAAAR